MKARGDPGLDSLFRVLGKEGAIEILSQAAGELTSGKDAIRRIGMSQKLYYSRLGELRRLGLLEKEGLRTYRVTDRGRLALDLQNRFVRSLTQNRSSLPVEARVIPDYRRMVEALSGQIEGAENRIKLATRYVDPTIAKSTFEALDRNVSIQVLYKSGMTHLGKLALDVLRMLKKDVTSGATALWKETRVSPIPFSFAIIDGHWSGVELVSPDDTFLAALEFEGDPAAAVLSVLFRRYYRMGTVFPRFW
jgi:DNA-binding HxlR family transcriptional regulator